MIIIIYVNNILIYCKDEEEIDNFTKWLKSEDIALHKEGIAEGCLGVDIKQEDGNFILTQSGLTKQIIKTLGLDS